MKTFVMVAKSSSFSQAARELAISGSLVSRHVADLERQLGLRLVNRTARSVSLTEAGRRYAEFAERILTEIDDEDNALSHSHDASEGTLSVICPPWIGTVEVGEAVAAFVRSHPRITIRFDLAAMSDRNYDSLDRGYDIAFHTRDLRASDVLVRRVSDISFVLAASTDYVRQHGVPHSIDDLVRHECIVHASDATWRFGSGVDAVDHRVQGATVVANCYLMIDELVKRGCGIALVPRRPVAGMIESGELIEVLPDDVPLRRPLYAVHRVEGQAPERVRIFVDFVTNWFAEHAALRSVPGVTAA